MAYRIGEVSKLLGLPVETIRYYEKEQIIAPNVRKTVTTAPMKPGISFF
jgi:transcriptional regulator, MerR family